mmetsp:Transcript_33293/g.53693  ORF Transcript_33293/g.53693 Transcript_33293/m.53693 type:complete len:735 (-) Transcript_33293:155-2359(-)|eukprot:CAMPEP_0203755144 /NCGR_PEP_ID=MMETSP0098-20131031/8638_1 /ASSEMBLY_ACC=CAM_ASM_000208 /TAXON_ID=96639 /ORGANISM=" , Strain NY0313808BC1" /LENGTH=734 /DNA_ID=CAMNT_0050646481 /DNA_START=75 /DNA_END=2279 /DNA_ORIENTATION=+
MGWYRALGTLATVLLLGKSHGDDGFEAFVPSSADQKVKNPGVKVLNNESRCEVYNGTLCEGIVDYPIYVTDYMNQSALEEDAIRFMAERIKHGSPQCREHKRLESCWLVFKPCVTIELEEDVFAAPRNLCQKSCQLTYQKCSEFYAYLITLGYGFVLASCGGGTEFSGINRPISQRIGDDIFIRQTYQPESYFVNASAGDGVGQDAWPVKHNIFTTPQGLEIEIPCLDAMNINHSESKINKISIGTECAGVVNVEYEGRCLARCPSYMFSMSDFDSMWLMYVIPGWIGFVFTLIILVQLAWKGELFRLNKNTKLWASLRAKQVGVWACLLYFIVGPGMSSLMKYDVKCNFLNVTFNLSENSKPSTACVISRSQVYVILLLLNIILANQIGVMHSLESAVQMPVARQQGCFSWFAQYLVRTIPVLLCIVMYIVEQVSTYHESPWAWKVHNAREAFTCSPKLPPAAEIILVHLPLVVTAGFVVFVSARSIYIVHSIAKQQQSSMGAGAGNSSKSDPSIIVLGDMMRKLSFLGLISAGLIIAYSITIATIMGGLKLAVDGLYDIELCGGKYNLARRHGNTSVRTASGCEAYAIMHNAIDIDGNPDYGLIHEDEFVEKMLDYYAPPAFAVGMINCVHSTFFALFSVFYVLVSVKSKSSIMPSSSQNESPGTAKSVLATSTQPTCVAATSVAASSVSDECGPSAASKLVLKLPISIPPRNLLGTLFRKGPLPPTAAKSK